MIITPLDIEKEGQKVNFTQTTHLSHVQFGKAQELLNAVHVVLPRANSFSY